MKRKRIAAWVVLAAFVAFIVLWFAVGPKMFDGVNDVTEYIGFICVFLILGAAIFRLLYDRCPRCGRWIRSNGTGCPYCEEDE